MDGVTFNCVLIGQL